MLTPSAVRAYWICGSISLPPPPHTPAPPPPPPPSPPPPPPPTPPPPPLPPCLKPHPRRRSRHPPHHVRHQDLPRLRQPADPRSDVHRPAEHVPVFAYDIPRVHSDVQLKLTPCTELDAKSCCVERARGRRKYTHHSVSEYFAFDGLPATRQ